MSDDQVLKLKRQVRDFYNKNVVDEATVRAVASAIGYIIPSIDENSKTHSKGEANVR